MPGPRSFIALLLLAAPLALVAWPGAASIFEADDRVTVAAHAFPVGVVAGAWGKWGSGFLIDECHMMTARHVVSRGRGVGRGGGRVVGKRIRFKLEPGAPTGPTNSSGGTIIAAGDPPSVVNDFSGDWAVARLDQCLGTRFGTLPIATTGFYRQGGSPALKPRLISIGYPADRGTMRLTIDPSCEARLRTSQGLQHDCASLPGNSGGPLIAWNDALHRYEAIGVAAGEIPTRRATAYDPHRPNLAVDLTMLRERISAAVTPKAVGETRP